MSKHTPGPWFIETGHHYRAIRTSDEVIANMREIGHCFNDSNARLIAAAPTMYALLAKRAAGGDNECKSLIESIGNE